MASILSWAAEQCDLLVRAHTEKEVTYSIVF